MKTLDKIRITLDDYQNLEEALSDVCNKLQLEENKIQDLSSLQEELIKISEDVVIELRQVDTIPDELLPINKVFEEVQQHNDHVYLIRGIG